MSILDEWETGKKRHPGKVVFVRLGSFLETFHSDAEYVADGCSLNLRMNSGVPMAGFPERAGGTYLEMLDREFVVLGSADFDRFLDAIERE